MDISECLLSINYFIKPILLASAPQTALTILVFALLFLLFLSFMISGAEVAYFSLSFRDVNLLKTRQQPASKRILMLLEDPRTLLASLIIANIMVNIAVIIVSNFLVDQWIGANTSFVFGLLIKVFLVSIFLILFGEVLPKVWASQNNLRFAYYASFLVSIINWFFKGFSGWMIGYSDKIEKTLGGGKTNVITLEELDQAIDMTTPLDATEEEKNILKGIVKFGNITVKQVMKSRLDVHGIDATTPFHELLQTVEELHYSRLPVYEGNLDNVIGVIHTKDLIPHLEEPNDYDWHQLLRQPYFVHEHKLIEDLLQEFQNKRVHFAVVVDEFGGTEGIVTLEDVMEEIIGDIRDEFDEEENQNKKIDEFNYLFDGKTMITEACKLMDLPIDTFDEVKGESETLAGLILELSGEIPKTNQVVRSNDFEFTILELEKNRILKLKITLFPKSET